MKSDYGSDPLYPDPLDLEHTPQSAHTKGITIRTYIATQFAAAMAGRHGLVNPKFAQSLNRLAIDQADDLLKQLRANPASE